MMFAATQGGRLVAIKNKKIVWNKPMAHSPSTSVVYEDGKLYIGTMEGVVLVHKASDGTALDPIVPRFKSSFLADLAIHKGAVIAGSENGKVRSFDMATRAVRWTVPTRDVVRSRAVIDGDRLFIGSLDGFVYGIHANGSRQVRLDLGAPISGSAAVHNGFLYAANSDGELAAFDVSGKRAVPWWTRRFDGEIVVHVITSDTHIFVVTDKSSVHAFAADKR